MDELIEKQAFPYIVLGSRLGIVMCSLYLFLFYKHTGLVIQNKSLKK